LSCDKIAVFNCACRILQLLHNWPISVDSILAAKLHRIEHCSIGKRSCATLKKLHDTPCHTWDCVMQSSCKTKLCDTLVWRRSVISFQWEQLRPMSYLWFCRATSLCGTCSATLLCNFIVRQSHKCDSNLSRKSYYIVVFRPDGHRDIHEFSLHPHLCRSSTMEKLFCCQLNQY